MRPEWKDFVGGKWENEVNVRDFIQKNYHLYEGDESFLAAPTQNTKDLWAQVLDLQKQEREVTKLTLKSANFSQHTEKHTMPAASTLITQR